MKTKPPMIRPAAAEAIRDRKPIKMDPHLVSYVTKGGTYMIATRGTWSDDHRPHDLVAIDQAGNVLQVSITANPDFVKEVEALA